MIRISERSLIIAGEGVTLGLSSYLQSIQLNAGNVYEADAFVVAHIPVNFQVRFTLQSISKQPAARMWFSQPFKSCPSHELGEGQTLKLPHTRAIAEAMAGAMAVRYFLLNL
jgi:hypothetical protein